MLIEIQCILLFYCAVNFCLIVALIRVQNKNNQYISNEQQKSILLAYSLFFYYIKRYNNERESMLMKERR